MAEISIPDRAFKEADFDIDADAPTLTIAISDSDAPARAWEIEVYAKLPDGSHYVGGLLTGTPPPQCRSRVLGYVCVPGALSWTVRIKPGIGWTNGAKGRLQIARHHQTISPPGIQPNGVFATVL